jgi:hypothetical protein
MNLAMAMVCPRCNTSYQDRNTCPACGIALVPAVLAPDDTGLPRSRPKWQQTALGRGVVGLLLSQGMYNGLLQLCTALVVAMGLHDVPKWWASWTGWSILQVLLVIGVVAGGVLAGAGQRRGPLYGAAVGLANGLLYLLVPKPEFPSTASDTFKDVFEFGQPVIQAALGALGGLIGMVIWRPLLAVAPPPAPAPVSPLSQHLPLAPQRPKESGFAGPVNWVRVAGGTILALMGSAWANWILNYMILASAGKLSLESTQHARFVTWEISALSVLLGSALAGASTKNGLKQGLIVGIFVTIGLLAIHVTSEQIDVGKVPAPALWLAVIHPAETPEQWDLAKTSALSLIILPLGLLGGWFGGQLLPPLMRPSRRKGLFAEV